jgi:hypothetical protein
MSLPCKINMTQVDLLNFDFEINILNATVIFRNVGFKEEIKTSFKLSVHTYDLKVILIESNILNIKMINEIGQYTDTNCTLDVELRTTFASYILQFHDPEIKKD